MLLATSPAFAQPPAAEVEPPPAIPAPRSGPSAPERALELHDEARRLYAEGRYRDAIDKLEQAIAVDPNAKLLYYNIGLIEERTGDLDSALDHYRNCLQLETDPAERVKLAGIIKRIEGARAERRALASPPAVASASAPNTAETAPAPAPRNFIPWIAVAGGVTVAAFAVGAGLAARASQLEPAAATSSDVTIDDLRDDAASAHDFAIGADVSFSVGAVAAVVTVVLVAVTLAGGDDRAERPLAWRF